jgi:hypothetical protein
MLSLTTAETPVNPHGYSTRCTDADADRRANFVGQLDSDCPAILAHIAAFSWIMTWEFPGQ